MLEKFRNKVDLERTEGDINLPHNRQKWLEENIDKQTFR